MDESRWASFCANPLWLSAESWRAYSGGMNDGGRLPVKIGLFTDTFDEINGVGRFLRDMLARARAHGRELLVHSCCSRPRLDVPGRRNFRPVFSTRLPFYPDLELSFPPVPKILTWARHERFDAIHLSTPGPMGLCGLLIAKRLGLPVVGTYHTDLPAYVRQLAGDRCLTDGTRAYLRWFYRRLHRVLVRSESYLAVLAAMGLRRDSLAAIPPGVNTQTFNPVHRDARLWDRLAVRQPHRLLYCGRLSVEKNLPLLAEIFRRLCAVRADVGLILAGDGPYRVRMQRALQGFPAYFLGAQDDEQLGRLYASADLFLFPSRTDTLGQVVLEAQASGLPALVSDQGGPRQIIEDGVTGLVVPATTPDLWCSAIAQLLDDAPRRRRMGQMAHGRASRFCLDQTFNQFWNAHAPGNQICTPNSRSTSPSRGSFSDHS